MNKTSMKAAALAVSVVTAAVSGCASLAPSLPPAPPQVIVDGERVFPESMASAAKVCEVDTHDKGSSTAMLACRPSNMPAPGPGEGGDGDMPQPDR